MHDNLYDPVVVGHAHWRYEVYAGSSIGPTIAEAIRNAPLSDGLIEFEFNGVTVQVTVDSDPDLIHRDWSRALNGYIDKHVGPHPNLVLTDEEKASDVRIEAENERRREERHVAYEAELRAKTEALDARLARAPEIEPADETAWREFVTVNSDGGYSECVVRYAEKWARLMQGELAEGKPLEGIAASTSSEVADVEGITGFQYGCAVAILAKTWKLGEELRRWHNLKTQLRDEGEKANEEGGVLNPALLNVSLG